MRDDPTSHLTACFAPDYAAARARFRALCARYGTMLRSYANPRRGPDGGELATDVAWFGPHDAARVMVLTSATHGVEGFCGSGAELDWLLRGGPADLPDDVAALVVHALNPFGFAWLRRVTEEGVDLNRNGIDFDAPLPDNPGFARLADAFLPESLHGPAHAAAQAKLAAYREQHGDLAFRTARAMGQHIDPKGLHYGGTEATWARRTLEAIIADYDLPRRRQVAVVDYHTGLGRFGYGEPICGSRPGEPGQARARAWYGRSLTEPMLGTSTSVVIPGLSQYIWLRQVGAEPLTFIALEYGTFADAEVEAAMVGEAWLHARGQGVATPEDARAIQLELKRVYHPATPDWTEMVLMRSRQILRQTMLGLAAA